MKVSDLIIDPRSIGETALLVDVLPVYDYDRNQNRTDTISAHKYVVVLPDIKFEKLGVKIEGSKKMEKPDDYVPVVFQNLQLSIYTMNGQPQVAARADGIALAKAKA